MLNDFRRYNYNANIILINALEKFENKKAHDLFSHILNAHEIWNSRIQGRQAKYSLDQAHSRDNYLKLNEELDEETRLILQNKNINEVINYKNLSGVEFNTKLSDILLHLFNHGTHHRAQISLLLRQEGIEPPKTDYIYHIRELS